MIKKELKGFNINIDDIEPNEITHEAMQELIEKIIIEENVKRFEIVLNKNILNIKDRFTDIHSYMGLKLSLEPLEKDISFIIRTTNELTYDELQQENKQLKENQVRALNKIRDFINNANCEIREGRYSNDKHGLYWELFRKDLINIQELIKGINADEYVNIPKYREEELLNLEDNWNKLKNFIGSRIEPKFFHQYDLIDKMQELEQGSDSNVKD